MAAIFRWEAAAQIWSRPPRFEVSGSHTHTHLLQLWTYDQLVTQAQHTQTQEANFHAFSGIRTDDPSNQVSADLRVRSHGHLDQQHDIRNPFCLCLVRLELWNNTEFLLQTALVAEALELSHLLTAF